MWLEKPEQWAALADRIRQAGEAGVDTETYGQPDKTSPQHRARIHCWSVAVLTETRHPRGYRRAVGRVLPAAALEPGSPMREVLEDPVVDWWAHNAPHDRHAFANQGVNVRRLKDTLQWARVAVPGMKDYGLKDMERWALGYDTRPEFWDMMTYEGQEVRARSHKESGCICGAKPCRKKKVSDWWDASALDPTTGEPTGDWRKHTRVEWRVFTPESKTVRRRLAVTDFVPGAALPPLQWLPPERPPRDRPVFQPSWWMKDKTPRDRLQEWWAYSLADAVRGIELKDWLTNVRPKELVYPWVSPKQLQVTSSVAR